MFMGKKKKDTYSVAKQSIKILQSGKIKFNKGEKISLKPFVTQSVGDCVCSRIDGILSKEKVVLDSSAYRVDVNSNLTSMQKITEMLSRIDNPEVQTVVHVVNKKIASEVFDMFDDSIIGNLMRSSTLASIYKEIGSDWESLNDGDKTNFTNVLFIPKIFIFLDPETGKIRKKPYTINLLLIAEPTLKNMGDGIEKVTETQATDRLINDVFDSAIKCGANNLVIAPYCHKLFLEDPYSTAGIWHDYTSIDKTIKNIKSITFAINNEELYIIFMKNQSYSNQVDSSLTT